ncbi:hypothetical protein H257_05324 [Aphanomyces astaci]|uniref:WH2 domain-containing protein n=1 Tax=Aphanomyces astaci TaxID=112090 RepID=W4GQW3_APHAT|nr:hypothetical protein H257_05324 [Aphanomyces astaci]ETV81731.1 hypothetical protein H257_05324 [Aphanomyces astaci]|eukprot:XP_009828468.1 hypothetical protein H257_05324 [Aphanomyces astaci]
MDKKRQPVHEGYLQWLAASAGGLQTQYCQLSWSCQLRMYPTETAAASGVGGRPFSIRGFCKWEGRGVLPLDSYGIELQLKDKGQSSIYLAAENRLDLERWCRAFVAVLDPSSDAADEIKRERRKVKRDIRKQAEKEAEIKAQEDEFKRRWIAQKKQELRDRELEIEQMTPLQRKDGLGTLDEETEALLRDRKKRLNKKAGQQVGRVGKQVLRRRMELLGGGKVVVHPNDATFGDIAASAVVGQRKAKVKVELPPPGQYFTGDESLRGHHGSTSGGRQSTTSSQDSATSADGTPFYPPPPPPTLPTSHGSSIQSQEGAPLPPPPLALSTMGRGLPINPMAAALDAIKRNRRFSAASDRDATTMGSGGLQEDIMEEPSTGRSNRTRDSQLSAEGKRMLATALSHHNSATAANKKSAITTTHTPSIDRKGLFDSSSSSSSSSSDDDTDQVPSSLLTTPVPAELAVVYLSAAVELRQAKSVAIYRFAFRLLAYTSTQCEFGRSYHEYEAIHGQLKRSVVMEVPWPNFPSRHVLRNPTKPDNMQKRAAEFLAYFEALVQIKAVVAHPAFHAAFQVPAAMATCLVRGTVVVEPPPPGIQIKQVAATTRKSQHKPRHLAKPGVPKRNLFEDDDEDEENEEASVASSVETPEPVKRPVADRVGSGSRRSLDERPHRGMEDRPPSSARKVALGTTDRPPSTKEIQAAGMPRPNLFGGGGRGDLLAAIRKGAQLNKVASPEDNDTRSNVSTTTATTNAPIRAPPPANSLLAALQQAPPLKKAGPPPATKVVAAPTPPLAAPSIHDSIAIAMASRLVHTQYGHSDDDSDDEWDD